MNNLTLEISNDMMTSLCKISVIKSNCEYSFMVIPVPLFTIFFHLFLDMKRLFILLHKDLMEKLEGEVWW